MKKINIVLFQPAHPRFKIFDSYREVIDSLLWGLHSLGYQSRIFINEIDHNAVNIVFGWLPLFHMGTQYQLPPNSILYNLEQYAETSMIGKPMLEAAAAHFQIWDYSLANIPIWQELNPKYPVYHAQIAFAPNLMRIPHDRPEDIDVLYIGSLGLKRAEKLITCASAGYGTSLVSLSSIWGKQRDEFIGRSKLLLNISNENPLLTIFEVVRISYYLANRKAVVCELRPDTYIEPDLQQVLRFATPAELGNACVELLEDPHLRTQYASDCFDVFSRRDVRDVISGFFD
jgi:hypothetical protein